MFVLLSPVLARADTTLAVGNASAYPGSTVPLGIVLRSATNMTAAQFDLSFNPSKVAPSAPFLGSALSNHVMKSREIAPGVHRLLVYSLANASITVTNRGRSVAAIPFQVSPMERVSSGPLTLNNAVLARNDATAFVPLTLLAGEISIAPVRLNPNGSADFFLPSEPGTNYVIQATTDFLDWVNISTNLATGNFLDLMDADAGNYPMRFYRLKSQ